MCSGGLANQWGSYIPLGAALLWLHSHPCQPSGTFPWLCAKPEAQYKKPLDGSAHFQSPGSYCVNHPGGALLVVGVFEPGPRAANGPMCGQREAVLGNARTGEHI